MKKWKGLLQNFMVLTLAATMIVPSSSFVFAESEEDTVKTEDSPKSIGEESEITTKEGDELEKVKKEEKATEEEKAKESEMPKETALDDDASEKETIVETVPEETKTEEKPVLSKEDKIEVEETLDEQKKDDVKEAILTKETKTEETKKELEEKTTEEQPEGDELKVEKMTKSSGESYTDGVYTGKASGKIGEITVHVIISKGVISDIDVAQNETPKFWEKAKTILDTIKELGSPSSSDIDDVDVVATATLSSKGIKEAVKDALAKALGDETIFSRGDGTAESPYLIANAVQLRNFAKSVNNGTDYKNQYIRLLNHIDVSGSDWVPIGSAKNAFGGIFDGNGKSVKNILIGTPGADTELGEAGLFGNLKDGVTIKNVTVDHADIHVVGKSGDKVYGAALVAVSGKDNTIDRCKVINSKVFVKSDDQQFVYVAGLVGKMDNHSTITNSYIDCEVNGESSSSVYAGGMVGITSNQVLAINNCTVGSVNAKVASGGKGTVSAISGGVVGMASGVIYNCYANNTVTATNDTTSTKVNKGALVGWCTGNGTVMHSYYNSDLTDGESVIMIPAGGTFVENIVDVKDKKAQEIADMLHNHLGTDCVETAKNTMKDKAPKKDFSFEENIKDKVFYDWEVSGTKVILSSTVWKEKLNMEAIFASGTGTKEEPYILETEEQLRKFAISLSDENTYAGKYINLNHDIDVTSKRWISIGEGEYPFCGSFDGNDHVIDGIFVKGNDGGVYNAGNDMYFGLFGVVGKGGIVKNLGVTNVDINVTGKGSTVAGGICGLLDQGTIDSCYATGSIKGQTTKKGNNYMGGLVGLGAKGYIVNSHTNTTVYSSVLPTSLAMSGGVVGMTNRTVVANCYSLGTTIGHTKRELEVVESMASVGGVAGVAGSPVTNCYAKGATISEDYSFYVGATTGWATGISELYNVYYNKESKQTIEGKKISPISDIGWKVKQGINEEGEVYNGALEYNVIGKTAEELQGQALADELNANFKAFPLREDTLPMSIQLKKWIVKDGVVSLSNEYAVRTYVEPPVEKPILKGAYYDGTFYGRAKEKTDKTYLNVKIEVKNKKVTSIVCDTELEGRDAVIQNVLTSNQIPDVEKQDSVGIVNFKNALRKAALKALKGDYSDYALVDAKIFAGGTGTKESPYRISTAEQLMKLAASVNEVEHFKDNYIVLTNDIDLSGIQWMPVGGSGLYAFSGTFDGKGYKISHMSVGSKMKAANYSCAGLFAHIDMATIKNLGVTDGYINISTASIPGIIKERTYVGMLAGYVGVATSGSGSVIDHCYVTGEISSDSIEHNYVGGMAGIMVHSTLVNSFSDCNIEAKSPGNWVYTGGLVGLPSFSMILNNHASGKIHSDATVNKAQLGGIGGMYSSYAFNNHTDVDLISERQTIDIGGIAGRNTGIGYIQNCYGSVKTIQKAGNQETTGMNAVGTIVQGDRYGKGQVIHSELRTSVDQNLVSMLNQNTESIGKDKMFSDLVQEWSIYLPKDLQFNTWVLKEGKLVFGTPNATLPSNGGSKKGSSKRRHVEDVKKDKDADSEKQNETTYIAQAVESKGSAKAVIKVKDIENNKVLHVESSVADVNFDGKALKAILKTEGTEVSIDINTVAIDSLSKEQQDIMGDRPTCDFIVKVGEKEISDFGSGTITIKIPYILREREKPEGLVVYDMDEQGIPSKVDTVYDDKLKEVIFKTSHLGKYMVGYDEKLEKKDAKRISFVDIAEGTWYADAVQYVCKDGIMNGISDSTFEPNTNTTRAMVSTILWNMDEKPVNTGVSQFKDVEKGSWYASSVIWATEKGMTQGVATNTFAPNQNVTREEFAQFLYGYAKYKNGTMTKTNDLLRFQDKPSSWAEDAVKWAVGNEIMNGKGDGVLDPQGTATRAEIAQMVMKYKEL